MTNEEQELLIAYLTDAGEIDPDGDVEAQFLDWYQVREGVVPGETHYKAILDAARVRVRRFDRGYRLAGAAGWVEEDPLPVADRQGVCDHDTPCGCYAEGHADGMAEGSGKRHNAALEDIARLRRILDHVNQTAEEAAQVSPFLCHQAVEAAPKSRKPACSGRLWQERPW